MDHLHWEVDINSDNVIVVSLKSQANVKVMDNDNYNKYSRGMQYRFKGGGAVRTPVHIRPGSGHWHVVVDLGGYSGRIEASISII